jgi:uncharacterized membrane protein
MTPTGRDPASSRPAALAAPASVEGLADHVEASVEAIANFHRDHHASATPLQRAIDWTTERLGRPVIVAVFVLFLTFWIVVALRASEGRIDAPLFTWLELFATLAALLIALLILATQRRQNQLGERRDQLTLELALLADTKAAKVIALIEELRRDHPEVADRDDPESEEMAKPADTGAVLAAIDRRTQGAIES